MKIITIVLVLADSLLVFYYNGLLGLLGAATAVFLLSKFISWMLKKHQKEQVNSDKVSLIAALVLYLLVWSITHNFFGIL
jgi:hypothetical protein